MAERDEVGGGVALTASFQNANKSMYPEVHTLMDLTKSVLYPLTGQHRDVGGRLERDRQPDREGHYKDESK